MSTPPYIYQIFSGKLDTKTKKLKLQTAIGFMHICEFSKELMSLVGADDQYILTLGDNKFHFDIYQSPAGFSCDMFPNAIVYTIGFADPSNNTPDNIYILKFGNGEVPEDDEVSKGDEDEDAWLTDGIEDDEDDGEELTEE